MSARIRPAASTCGGSGSRSAPRQRAEGLAAQGSGSSARTSWHSATKAAKVGLLELHCPHRGTSLEFGLVGAKGIRCCYHGWLFGCDGAILETPGEPADEQLKDRLFHGAYPMREAPVWSCLYGPARRAAAAPGLRQPGPPGLPGDSGPEMFLSMQLAADQENTMDPRIPRSSTRLSAARCSPTSLACCPNSTSSRPRSA